MTVSYFTDALDADVLIGTADSTARARLTPWIAGVSRGAFITLCSTVTLVTDTVTCVLLCATNTRQLTAEHTALHH